MGRMELVLASLRDAVAWDGGEQGERPGHQCSEVQEVGTNLPKSVCSRVLGFQLPNCGLTYGVPYLDKQF